MKIIKNACYDRFQCLAGSCPDSCCQQWEVEVDEKSEAYYRSLSGPLGERLRQVLKEEDGETFMAIENGRCPMWRMDGLCRIQAELGYEALCRTCREFPRLTHDYGDFVELGLELSCPEAARLLLTGEDLPPVVQECPGGDRPDYDREAMEVLLRTRREALSLLEDAARPFGQTLALLLLFGYHAQAQLDGAESVPFDRENTMKTAREFAKPGDIPAFLAFYADLEILTPQWKDRLAAPSPAPWSKPLQAMVRYGIRRYWLQAVSDYDLIGRVKMVLCGCLVVKLLGGDPISTAQLYAKEIENSLENTEALLDAAYQNPAFTDDKLLWLLLAEK